jgi:hypothetical protein
MTKPPRNNKRELLIIIFSVMTGVFLGFIFSNKINLVLNNSFLSKHDKSREIIFESNRVPFAFKYPKDFKIAVLPDRAIYQFDNRVEAINLGTFDAAPNAGGSATGYIIVNKVPLTGLTLEEQLQQEYQQETAAMKAGMGKNAGSFTRPVPTYTKVQIGNSEGIKVMVEDPNRSANFFPTEATFYVERRGLRYIIGITTSDKVEREKIEAILKTFDFKY